MPLDVHFQSFVESRHQQLLPHSLSNRVDVRNRALRMVVNLQYLI